MDSGSAYTTTTTTTSSNVSPEAAAVFGGIMLVFTLIILVVAVIMAVASWKIYKKAGQPGWAAIVPIYNYHILLKIVGRPGWWILPILFLPYLNLVFVAITLYDLGRSFGKSKDFSIWAMIIFSLYGHLKLGFGSDQYAGPYASRGNASTDGSGGVVPTVTPQPAPAATPTEPVASSGAAASPQPAGPVPGQTFGATTQPPVDSSDKQA